MFTGQAVKSWAEQGGIRWTSQIGIDGNTATLQGKQMLTHILSHAEIVDPVHRRVQQHKGSNLQRAGGGRRAALPHTHAALATTSPGGVQGSPSESAAHQAGEQGDGVGQERGSHRRGAADTGTAPADGHSVAPQVQVRCQGGLLGAAQLLGVVCEPPHCYSRALDQGGALHGDAFLQ